MRKTDWIWGVSTLFYLYQFILRVSPSLMVEELMSYHQLDASSVGHLSALAMYAYAAMQIPSGLLVDLLGVRRILLASITLCFTGMGLFATTHQLWIAQLARILLGIGSASSFLCVGKISTLFFPPHRRGLLLGITLAMGTLGGFLGSAGMSRMMAFLGWQRSLLCVNYLGIIVFILCFIIIPKIKKNSTAPVQSTFLTAFQGFSHLLKYKTVWIYSMVGLGIYLCVPIFADNWGVSFVMRTLNIEKVAASQIISLIYVGLFFGSILISFFGDRWNSSRTFIQTCASLICLCAIGIIYHPIHNLWVISILFFSLGFLAGSTMLCFSSLCELVEQEWNATAIGVMNCMITLGSAFITQRIGRVLDLVCSGESTPTGLKIYSDLDYQNAFTMVVITLVFTAILTFFLPSSKSPSSQKSLNISEENSTKE